MPDSIRHPDWMPTCAELRGGFDKLSPNGRVEIVPIIGTIVLIIGIVGVNCVASGGAVTLMLSPATGRENVSQKAINCDTFC